MSECQYFDGNCVHCGGDESFRHPEGYQCPVIVLPDEHCGSCSCRDGLWIARVEGHAMGPLLAVGRTKAEAVTLVTKGYRFQIKRAKGDYGDPADVMSLSQAQAEIQLDEYFGVHVWNHVVGTCWDTQYGQELL